MSAKHPGPAIRRARRAIEMHQHVLAERIGRSGAWLCFFERGRIDAKPEEVRRMRAAIKAHAAARKVAS